MQVDDNLHFDPRPDRPQLVGYKTQWFAMKSTDTDSVVQILGLTDLLSQQRGQ
ncbi:hypothetical protein [Paenibacillus sp. CCS19]|uniref:hypothetical protein n=1 Tax=Paenibacillus sp. CCS19 TaxID=3158387 RepID=UPI00295E7A7A|nr:hypothetical protein [Paenibacillus cellulosilyticus]